MRIKSKILPFEIYIDKNTKFFAEIAWLKYKYFKKTRDIPCGRTKKDKYLCCCQPWLKERIFLSEDKKTCYCKVCNSVHILSNQEIDINKHYWQGDY